MFDLGWSELLVIGIVALIVVGPKDLPGMFRALGKFTAKLRRMAREFQRAMEDAADEAGVKDAAKDFRNMTNPSKMGMDSLKEAADDLKNYDPDKPSKPRGPETSKLTEERAEAARKIREYSTKKTQERLDREAAEAAEASAEPETPPATEDKA
ncbi:twin-arginine translocase subunit TatB [Alphaproteobacteria bacterium GH1-50]|uniref:Sec-independent protein translocase protein TatB n=1 Tax=Kangsaoukella pontilimi TaxID=2691042 RepID=A0A7C9NDU1_9RHOB|nr:Sec-independent protein translocase protein TatB [Kangsaoukella pontilimi]MXQ07739.1 twin-arginine translocase subunit TatB [Kangsaoukella pontilimi]